MDGQRWFDELENAWWLTRKGQYWVQTKSGCFGFGPDEKSALIMALRKEERLGIGSIKTRPPSVR